MSLAASACITLAPGQVIACHLRTGHVLQVTQGQLWLTRAGDAQDHVLGPGQRWLAAGREQVWLSALGPGAAQLSTAGGASQVAAGAGVPAGKPACARLSASVVRPWPSGRQPGGPKR